MSVIVYYIITALVGIMLGMGAMLGIQASLPPKTQIQNITQIQQTENQNTSIQESAQAQITTTVITGNTNFSMHVQYQGKTNFTHSFSSATNRKAQTNIRKKTVLPPIM